MKVRSILLFCILFGSLLTIPVSATLNVISQGDDVFIGEAGLNISAAIGNYSQIAWFALGSDPTIDVPDAVFNISDPTDFYVAPIDFVDKTGTWYRWDGGAIRDQVAFSVVDPSISIMIWDQNTNKDVSGKTVAYGNFENFRLQTNLYSVVMRPGYSGEGFIDILVTGPDGTNYTALLQSTTESLPLTYQSVDTSPWYWVLVGDSTQGWNTGVTNGSGGQVYQPGEYTIRAYVVLHNMIDNYRAPDGSVYVGKTVTTTNTVTIAESLIQYVELNSGWNIFSTPIVLESGYSRFDQVFSPTEQEKILVVLGWDGSGWYIPSADTGPDPLDAYYIKVDEGMTAEAVLVPSESISTLPARYLDEGINLIGPAPAYDSGLGEFPQMPLDQALISIEQVPGGNNGYIMVVSPGLNQPSWTYALGGIIHNFLPYKGYWVVMENGDTLYGFSTTPIV